jgi:hypothetical protein
VKNGVAVEDEDMAYMLEIEELESIVDSKK